MLKSQKQSCSGSAFGLFLINLNGFNCLFFYDLDYSYKYK